MATRRYTEEEVTAILRRAVERHGGGGLLEREDLVEAAREVGIEPSAVHDAIDEFDRDRDLQREIDLLRRQRQRELGSSAATWAIVNTGLLALCGATGGDWLWACAWTAGPWGMWLLLRAKGALLPNPRRERKLALRALEERQERERRRRVARLRAERARGAGWGVESMLEQGVSELLSAAARRMGVRVEEAEEDLEERADAERRPRRSQR